MEEYENVNVDDFLIKSGVKYEDKELAKSVGAKFDPISKAWYFQYEFEEFATNADKHTYWFKPHEVVLNFDSHVSKKDSVNYFSMAVKAMDKRHNKYVLNNPKPITQKLKKPIVFIDDPFVSAAPPAQPVADLVAAAQDQLLFASFSFRIFSYQIMLILSAWFYRGHSPNLDFFQVRPWFKEIAEGKRPRVKFDEYLEMHEYQNIQTRMLGADSFPYRNVTVNDKIFEAAVEAIDHLYFIGLQEEFDLSVQLLLRMTNITMEVNIIKERDQNNENIVNQKMELKSNRQYMKRLEEVNTYDYQLYKIVTKKFCDLIKVYPDLYNQVIENEKVKCT
eukprot:gene7603-10353_t